MFLSERLKRPSLAANRSDYCRLTVFAASTENVAAGSYKMSRPLNLVTPPKTSKLVSEFIAYCQSADVHDLIRAQFFVPLKP